MVGMDRPSFPTGAVAMERAADPETGCLRTMVGETPGARARIPMTGGVGESIR